MTAVDKSREIKACGVVGFGGGSSMDVAKLTALLVGSGEDIQEAWGPWSRSPGSLPSETFS